MAFFTTIILGILAVGLFLFYKKRKNETNIFKAMGIPGPEPHWFYGNVNQFSPDISSHITIQTWAKKYGKIFGYYEGNTPILVTGDPDMVQEVLIRQFSNFHGRKPFALDKKSTDQSAEVMMLKANGHQWKRLRSIISPTFSTGKLREIQHTMSDKVEILMKKFKEHAQNNRTVNVLGDFQQMTLDVIGETAFGLDLNAQENPDEIFLQKARETFAMSNSTKRPFIISAGLIVPEIRPMLFKLMEITLARMKNWPFFWLGNTLAEAIDYRRSQKQSSRRDLLQLMLDAEADENDIVNVNMWEMTDKEDQVKESAPTTKKSGRIKKLTNKEIEQQGVLFLLAGYETTSSVLAYTAYLLAINPDIQTKLQQEVDKAVEEHGGNLLKASSSSEYLDMVIKESLRIYPVAASVVNRQCMQETTVNGLHIPEGMMVQVNSFALHFDKDIWGPEPEKFEPERFRDKDIHPGAYIPFGAGPRNCIGMRFGLMEAKLTLASIMKEFTFEKCQETQIPLKVVENASLSPVDGVTVKIVQRV